MRTRAAISSSMSNFALSAEDWYFWLARLVIPYVLSFNTIAKVESEHPFAVRQLCRSSKV